MNKKINNTINDESLKTNHKKFNIRTYLSS